jgi:hypothetical protein
LRRISKQGRADLANVQNCPTNDLGEYRLSELEPGRYYVRAAISSSNMIEGDVRTVGLASVTTVKGLTYYPSALGPLRANDIDVTPGSEISGIDILLTASSTFRIRGRVFNSIAGKSSGGVSVQVFSRESEGNLGNPEISTWVNRKDGAFSLAGVRAGSYSMLATWQDEGKTYYGEQTVEIENVDVDGVQLVITAGVDISGRLVTEGKSSLQATNAHVQVIREGPTFWGYTRPTRATSSGAFLLPNIRPGSYRIRIFSSCDDCYLKSAHAGDEDIFSKDLEVAQGAAPPPLELVYSSNGGTLDGVVPTLDGLPAIGAIVVVVPDSSHRRRDDLYKDAITDQFGHFLIHGIAPGKYKVFAWEKVDFDTYHDPDSLALIEDQGMPFEISENEKKTLQLKLIPAETGNPTK